MKHEEISVIGLIRVIKLKEVKCRNKVYKYEQDTSNK